MSNKKKRAREKRLREQQAEALKNETKQDNPRKGTRFTRTFTGIIFILTAVICITGVFVYAFYTESSVNKYVNMVLLALMAAYFLYKAPSYFRKK